MSAIQFFATIQSLSKTKQELSHTVPTVPLICNDTDFNTALELVKILIQHAANVYNALPTQTETPKQPNQKQQFLETLPTEFSRQDYLKTAQSLNILDKTTEKYIAKFVQNGLINHFAHGKYRKP